MTIDSIPTDFETDDLPVRFCENCLGENSVTFDAASGRRLCIDCEPNPILAEPELGGEG